MSFLLGVAVGVSSTVLVFLLACPPDPVPAGQPAPVVGPVLGAVEAGK